MGVFDVIHTDAGRAAIERLAKDLDGCTSLAESLLRMALLVPKDRLERLIARKAWANPRHYDAAVEAVKLK